MVNLTIDRLGRHHGIPNKSNTRSLRFNEIKHLVKEIPTGKKFDGKMYSRHTSSFSSISQSNAAKQMKNAGINVRTVVYKRAGRDVYTLYTR